MTSPSDVALLLALLALALVVAWLVAVVARRRTLLRRGAVECGWRRPAATGRARRWHVGLLTVTPEALCWHRLLSPAGARRVVPRESTRVVGQRALRGNERSLFDQGSVVLRADVGGEAVELAVPRDGATGILAWLESAPPGEARL